MCTTKTEICETVLEICGIYFPTSMEVCEIDSVLDREICENLNLKLQKFVRKLFTEICAT